MSTAKKDKAMHSISERLRFARAQMGWSQADLASACGLAVAQISRYESGRNAPRPETIKKLADAMKVAYGWLATGAGVLNEDDFLVSPQPGQREVTFEITADLYKLLRERAEEAGISVNEQVRKIILEFYAERVEGDEGNVEEIAKRVAERLGLPFPGASGQNSAPPKQQKTIKFTGLHPEQEDKKKAKS